MSFFKHPAVMFGVGVLVGVVAANKLRGLPGVSKLPSV